MDGSLEGEVNSLSITKYLLNNKLDPVSTLFQEVKIKKLKYGITTKARVNG
jgi:hypothetical protein